MAHGLKSYDKYSVKTGRDGRWMFEKDGSPVLDEKLSSGVMLDEMTVKNLNGNVKNYGFYFVDPEKKQEVKEQKEPESVVVAKIDLPQPPNAEELAKDLTLEKLLAYKPEEVDAALSLTTKAKMLELVGIEMEKNKIQITNHASCMVLVKEKLNELKAK